MCFEWTLACVSQGTVWRSGFGSKLPFSSGKMEARDRGPFSNDILTLFLDVVHTDIYSRAFQRMGLLHRLDWEGNGRDGAGGA